MPEVASDDRKMTLRRKILGVKIRHARNRAGLSLKEVSEAVGISTNGVSDIEFGHNDPSLPQLELMALLFNVPVIYFLSDVPLEEIDWEFPAREAIALRQRIIGVLLRQARIEAGRSPEDLADVLNVTVELISEYELGICEIPLPELEVLAEYLNVAMNYFLDEGISPGKVGEHVATLDEIAQFAQMPAEVRQFLLNPANLLYINLAMRLSDLSAETLRNLAEGLLEITY